MDKKYYIWLQEIANVNCKFTVKEYLKIQSKIGDISALYENIDFDTRERLKSIGIHKSIIENLEDGKIKEKSKKIYFNLIKLNFNIITYENYYSLVNFNQYKLEVPFCFISSNDFNFNLKRVYIYYPDYLSKYAQNIIKYIAKIITVEGGMALSEYKDESVFLIRVEKFENINEILSNEVILPDERYLSCFFTQIIDMLVIVEAKYEKNIVCLVDMYLELGKDIYVVPSNIFNKNSYFSNYLIKQGADIILNNQDIKFILGKNTRWQFFLFII